MKIIIIIISYSSCSDGQNHWPLPSWMHSSAGCARWLQVNVLSRRCATFTRQSCTVAATLRRTGTCSPNKCHHFPWQDEHPITWLLQLMWANIHTASWSVQPFLNSSWSTDRQTDRQPRYSIFSNSSHLCHCTWYRLSIITIEAAGTVARSAKLYWWISVKTSNVGLFDISPPSRNWPNARKYVGAAPLDRAALHTNCSVITNMHALT